MQRRVLVGNATTTFCPGTSKREENGLGVRIVFFGQEAMGKIGNSITSVTTIRCINSFLKIHLRVCCRGAVTISDKALRDGVANVIRNTHLMGRWQVLQEDPLTIADTGHNVDGIKEVVRQLCEMSYLLTKKPLKVH